MSLKEKAIKGFAWNAIGTVGAGLCNLIITIVLARLLTPADFGLLALLVVFTLLSETLIDSGFSQALIQDGSASSVDYNTVFFSNLCIAFFLYIILFLSAPFIADFYENNKLIDLSRFVFIVLVFNAFSIIQKTIFSKSLDFRVMAFSSLFAVILSGAISIVLAFKGFGAWALAIHLVFNSFFQMIFLWFLSEWRPSGGIKIDSLKKYLPFSLPLLIQGFVDRFVTNFESLLIGKFYSINDLGFFSQSKNLNAYLMQALSNVVQRVTYPVLVKIKDDHLKLKEGYRQVIGTTMLFMLPLSFGVVAAADNVVLVLFGDKWIQTAEYLRFFIIMGLFISLQSSYTNVFLTLAKTKLFLQLSLIKQILKVATVIYLIGHSVKALVIGVTFVGILSSLIYIYVGGKLVGYSLKDLIVDISEMLIASFLSALLVFGIDLYFSSINIFLILLIQIIVMITAYISLLFLFENIYLNEILRVFMRLIFKKNK